jgi:hypothetical protein
MKIKQGTQREDGLVFYGVQKGKEKWITQDRFIYYRNAQTEWRLKNKERAKELVKNWIRLNSEKVKQSNKNWRKNNPEKIKVTNKKRLERLKAQREDNKKVREEKWRLAKEQKIALKQKRLEERIVKKAEQERLKSLKPKRVLLTIEEKKLRKLETNKKYFKNNPEAKEKRNARRREWEKTPEQKIRRKEWAKRYYKKYPEKLREKRRNKRKTPAAKKRRVIQTARKRKSNPLFALKHRIRSTINKCLTRCGYTKRSKSLDILGCSWEEFYKHIESKFTEGMTWSNRGMYGWHIDHIVPLAVAKTEEEIIKLNHYTNLQPLWGKENMNKKDELPDGREARNVTFSDIEHLLKQHSTLDCSS